MLDQTPQRAVIINTLIDVFNTESINDKTGRQQTSSFLDERVSSVEAELDELESEAEDYVNGWTNLTKWRVWYAIPAAIVWLWANAGNTKGQLELVGGIGTIYQKSQEPDRYYPDWFWGKRCHFKWPCMNTTRLVLDYQQQAKINYGKRPGTGQDEGRIGRDQVRHPENISSIRESFNLVLTRQKPKRPSMIKKFDAVPERTHPILLKRQIGVKEQLYLSPLQKKEETELSLVSTINKYQDRWMAFDKGSKRSSRTRWSFALLIEWLYQW